MLGGSVNLQSEIDKGTTVTFTLPITTKQNGKNCKEIVSTKHAKVLNNKTILITEDDDINFQLF